MKLFFLLCGSLLLVGCATGYHRDGGTGGYSDVQLDDNLFQVSFRGNRYTRYEQAMDLVLLRAAEVTTAHGFRYFIVLESHIDASVFTYTTPSHAFTTGSVSNVGNTAYGSAIMTTSGGETYVIHQPMATKTIVCFTDKPAIAALVFDAELVNDSLKRTYGLTH